MKWNLKVPWVSQATREFFRIGSSLPGYRWSDKVHGYIYGRWTYLYIGLGIGDYPLAKRVRSWIGRLAAIFPKSHKPQKFPVGRQSVESWPSETGTFADGYHGKVVTLAAARQLVTVKEDIRLPDLEQVIPYSRARDIVLQNPDHIVALVCPCRSARENPCLPLDVCLIVGEPFAGFVMQHHPARARWIDPNEAVAILQAEDARGHVHHAFFKDAMFGRFYAICNCCACCCGAMQSQRNGTPMLASSGYVCRVDDEQCVGCGECASLCQFGVISLVDFVARVDAAACMGCGICVHHCPQEALSLARAPERGEPLEILALMEKVRL